MGLFLNFYVVLSSLFLLDNYFDPIQFCFHIKMLYIMFYPICPLSENNVLLKCMSILYNFVFIINCFLLCVIYCIHSQKTDNY